MAYRKKDPQETIEELKARKEALRASFDDKLNAVDAELKAAKAKLRKEEERARTHINIIIGAAVQNHAEIDPDFKAKLWNVLDKAVTRPDQRESLGLPPRPDPET